MARDEADPFGKKLASIEEALKSLEGKLSSSAGAEEGDPKILEKQVEDLANRLSTLEGKAGTRASLEGQEDLPGAGKGGKTLWKGVV